MCMNCWHEYDAPKIVNYKTLKGLELVEEVYHHNPVGGGLHVILDDWNLDAVNSRWTERDSELTPEEIQAEEACLKAFKAMTIEERASVLAMFCGFFEPPTNP